MTKINNRAREKISCNDTCVTGVSEGEEHLGMRE